MRKLWGLVALAIVLIATVADARPRTHQRSHQWGFGWGHYYQHSERRATSHRHSYRHHGKRSRYAKRSRKRERGIDPDSLATVTTAVGLTTRVIASAKEQFQGFIRDVEKDWREPETGELTKGNRITDIGCYEPRGHMRQSKHHWGGACDFMQTARDKTAAFMRHVTAIADKWGLTDGCTWSGRGRYGGPDCGHIEVKGSNNRYANRYYATRFAGRE